jgi:hypothetical protein
VEGEASAREENACWAIDAQGRDGPLGFLCECYYVTCRDRVWLTVAEFEAVRAGDRLAVVVPGHEDSADILVSPGDGYLIVRGERGRV